MHTKRIISNSMIGVIYKIMMLFIGFISRKIFIIYLGEEVLGLNSLYANLLELLNLADLGIGVAVQYQLYEPLVHQDRERLSKILSAAKKLYNRIGFAVLAGGIILSFFIQYLIKSTTYSISYVRISFLISVTGIALGYFFVHKRLFLQANEELSLVNIVDISAKLITTTVSLIMTICFSNYFIYLIINALYGVISNLIIHFVFSRRYSYISVNRKDNDNEIRELTSNLKNVVPMKLSNYVYNSTDNVIVSKVLGLTTVALYSNYMTIINGIMGIEYLLGNVVTSSMGKIIKEETDNTKLYQYYLIYQYIQFLFTNFCTVSLAVLCTPFIKLWIGERFLATQLVFWLLIGDFFVHSMYQPAYVMYGAAGKFKEDKYVTLLSAIMNIVISVIMVNIIGLSGVIVGTLVTDIYIWIVRSYQVVRGHFRQSGYAYLMKMIKYIIITALGLITTCIICRYINVDNLFVELILKGIICLLVPNIIGILASIKSLEMNEVFYNLKKVLSRR